MSDGKKRWTYGELIEISKHFEPELSKLDCGIWNECAIDINSETNLPIIRLTLRRKSRFERWLYKMGFKKLPEHPKWIGGLEVLLKFVT